jgi:hypothetical protein
MVKTGSVVSLGTVTNLKNSMNNVIDNLSSDTMRYPLSWDKNSSKLERDI